MARWADRRKVVPTSRTGPPPAGGGPLSSAVAVLVLPGPGWVVIFIGLGIWATEFAWADSLLGSVRRKVASWTAWIGRRRVRRQ
jgi:hypothetical protein